MKQLLRQEDGVSLAELALLLPVFLLLVLGVFDFGNGFNTYIGMTNAAREGALWIASFPDDKVGMEARINTELARVGLNPGEFTVTPIPNKSSYNSGEKVTVQIEHIYPMMFGAMTKFAAITLHTETTTAIITDP